MAEATAQAPSVAQGRCGYASLVGRPNVGKSTLLNCWVGQKIAATTRRPQTTRNRLLGVITAPPDQLLLVDTPGIHQGERHLLNRTLNRNAIACLQQVDVNLFVVTAGQWQAADEAVLRYLNAAGRPVILVVNKIDRLKRRQDVLPFIDQVRHRHDFAEIVPVAARTGTNVAELQAVVMRYLPTGPMGFAPDAITDRSLRFIVAETVREQLMERLGQELPYAVAVVVDRFAETALRTDIEATIWVARDSHKPMVIGEQGKRLKQIGSRARQVLETQLETQVYLQLWVRVNRDWQTHPEALAAMGVDVDFADGKAP